MATRQKSRELAARVERQFQRRARPLRRWLFWISFGASLLLTGIVVATATRQHHWLYSAGPLASPHRSIENNCAACHQTWAPLARLASFTDAKNSVPDAKCQDCHQGPPHYQYQDPPHAEIGCAECHREHRPDQSLIEAAQSKCVQCHRDLKQHANVTGVFAAIHDFDKSHPEFDAKVSEKGDVAQIRFNHKKHLHAAYDSETGALIEGVLNERGVLEDLSQNCAACHEPDAERRFMQPINFEQHCQRCHPLLFDLNAADRTVPHEAPQVVLGFLTHQAMKSVLSPENSALQRQETARPLPGFPQRPQISSTQADAVDRRVETAAQVVWEHTHVLFGPEAKGGCRFCHNVTEKHASADAELGLTRWEITPPEIPPRWMDRARFAHDSHRFLKCTECHQGVAESELTKDVLLPGIQTCQRCHASEAKENTRKPLGEVSLAARAYCIDCHAYHWRENEGLDGKMTIDRFQGMDSRTQD